jgi:hypothetical protein
MTSAECADVGGRWLQGIDACTPNPCEGTANLSGGVLITHYVPELTYSTVPPPEGWCDAYQPYAINDCGAQNTRIDVAGESSAACWYVLAAWADAKEWCQVQFGVEPYDPALFTFIDSAPCFPPGGGFESSSEGWPGPAEGTRLIAGPSTWAGNFAPVYWFAGYAYSAASPGRIHLGPDRYSVPDSASFGGFVACGADARSYDIREGDYGAFGINTDGIAVCPAGRLEVCCVAQDCQLLAKGDCDALGGVWRMDWNSCDPNPCEVSAVDASGGPAETLLHEPLPNPSSGGAVLRYDLAQAGSLRLDIFDLSGRHVRALFDGGRQCGRWLAVWDGRDSAGRQVPGGVYCARLRAGSESQVRRLLLLR